MGRPTKTHCGICGYERTPVGNQGKYRCRRCTLARCAKWREENPEEVKAQYERSKLKPRDRTEYSKKRWADPGVRARSQAYLAKYRVEKRGKINAKNGEYHAKRPGLRAKWLREWRERNPGYHAEEVRAWNKSHPEHRRAQWHRRRALELAAPGSWTPQEWKAIKASQNNHCFDCGAKAELTVGHLIPLKRDGSNYPSNLVGQCLYCNSHQYTKLHPSLMIECNQWHTSTASPTQ